MVPLGIHERRAERARMKLCCSTAAFGDAIEAGEMTQLEWLDVCANELDVQGVDFDGRFFPRTDDEYLAQLKKLCADRCLTVACASAPAPFGGADMDASIAAFTPWIGRALALGSPLLWFSCASAPEGSPGIAWRELIRGLKSVCVEAKRLNVTLALARGEDGSLVASPADTRRALKECDSAWLRVAMRAEDLAADQRVEWQALLAESVVMTSDSGDDAMRGDVAPGFRGFLSIRKPEHIKRQG